MSATAPSTDELSVLVICTGNRFRSPLAAAVLTHELRGVPVKVFSRGTLDVGSLPPLVEAIDISRKLGLDVSKHRARPLRPEDLRGVDLVIGFETQHLEAAQQAGVSPVALFDLEQIVKLLVRLDRRPSRRDYAASVRNLLAEADSQRDAPSVVVEIEDPIGKSSAEALAIGRRVHALSLSLARLLSPRAP
jgi:protein-tyrosine phosphatase